MASEALTDSLRETLTVFETHGEPGEPMTTSEVTDHLDVSRRSTYERLERLVAKRCIETKKVGSRGRVWWRPVETILDDSPFDGPDRMRSQQTSREERIQFRTLIGAIEEYATYTLDADGRVKTWNSGAKRVNGYDSEQIVGEHVSTFYADDDVTDGVPEQHLREAAADGATEDEGWRIREDGSRFWAHVTIAAVRDEDGSLEGYAKVVRDMTTRREHEDQLREKNAFIESILDSQRDIVYAFDANGTFLRWNDRFREVTGYTDAQIAKMQPVEFVTDEASERTTAAIERVIEDGENETMELPLETADGTVLPYEFNAAPITDEGNVVGLTGVGRDVSERKAKERRLARQREELESEIEEVYGRISDAFYALDDEFRFTHVNERAEELLRHAEEELLGKSVWDVFPEAVETDAWECFHEALEKQAQTSFELYFDPLEFWVEANVYPSETGLSVYFRNVTERKERERELEQYETSIETFGDGVYALDSDERFVMVNDAFCELTGYERDELLGTPAEMVHNDETTAAAAEQAAQVVAGERDVGSLEHSIQTRAGDVVSVETRFRTYEDGDDTYARTGVVRDVSDRKKRERKLQRRVRQQEVIAALGQRALEDRDPDTVMAEAVELMADALDNDFCTVLDFDPDSEELFLREDVGWTDDIVGSPTVSADDDDSQAAYTLASEDPVVVEDFGTESRFRGSERLTSRDARSGISVLIGPSEDPWGILTTHDTARKEFSEQDINFVQSVANTLASVVTLHDSERKLGRQRSELQERERALRRTYEIIADPDRSLSDQIDDLLRLVRERVGTDYATLSRVHDDEYVFEAVEVPNDVDIRPGDTAPLEELPNCERVCETERTLVLRDVEAEAPELADPTWGISCYLGAPVTVDGDVYGTFCFYDVQARANEFSDWEIMFVEILGNWVSTELERQQNTEQLAALNELNEVVRGITDAVVEQSTREEIEAVVCEHLANTESYQLAWIGDVDTTTQTVTPQTEAGVEGYHDDVTISVDPDDRRSKGPTGRALRTGDVQTTQDVQNDPGYEPWRDTAEEYGFRSSAAIPIVHEDTIYGVLNVYTERSNAFEGQERTVISQLGELVGHAIAAIERKRALMSDEIVELEFQVPNVFESFEMDVATGGTITIDETVPITDDEYLAYGHAPADAGESIAALVEAIPHWKDVTMHDEDGDIGFELQISESTVLSVLSSMGGSVDEAIIEDGTFRMTFTLSPSVDVRQIIEAVREIYPTAEMVKRRQRNRGDESAERIDSRFAEALTDRQLATLQAAYQAGFFEWPRDMTGEDLAESLGVSPPTFHQHLRNAERKVFDSLLSST